MTEPSAREWYALDPDKPAIMEAAAPRPWLVARRMAAIALGIFCGFVLVAWMVVALP